MADAAGTSAVDIFVGIVMVLIELGLILGGAALGDATHRSNVAFTKGRAFAGPGWGTYNRFVYRLVGACVAVAGIGIATGLIE